MTIEFLDALADVQALVAGFAARGTTMSPAELGELAQSLGRIRLAAAIQYGGKCERIERLVHALVVAGLTVPK